ncbi:MAG: NAD(P)-binding protein [Synechococcus sp.]
MVDADLAIIGAGLAGCSLIARLRQLNWSGTIALVEAGRGPGGRTATRRRRDRPRWRLDHGAPGFHLDDPLPEGLKSLLDPLRENGCLRPVEGTVVTLAMDGSASRAEGAADVEWLEGQPFMASICEALLAMGEGASTQHFGRRIRTLQRDGNHWCLSEEGSDWQLRASRLVLSGNLLAHPRSLAMLDWRQVPLREAVPAGQDPDLDQALDALAQSRAAVRWNLMLDLPLNGDQLPRQIWLTPEAQAHWRVERLVLQPQADNRTGLVMHGLDSGEPITPQTQPVLLKQEEARLRQLLPQLLQHWPDLQGACEAAESLGVMRWGASRPLDHPLPQSLQWCDASALGFCGDYVEGPGFGRAEGALRSAVNLAQIFVTQTA